MYSLLDGQLEASFFFSFFFFFFRWASSKLCDFFRMVFAQNSKIFTSLSSALTHWFFENLKFHKACQIRH